MSRTAIFIFLSILVFNTLSTNTYAERRRGGGCPGGNCSMQRGSCSGGNCSMGGGGCSGGNCAMQSMGCPNGSCGLQNSIPQGFNSVSGWSNIVNTPTEKTIAVDGVPVPQGAIGYRFVNGKLEWRFQESAQQPATQAVQSATAGNHGTTSTPSRPVMDVLDTVGETNVPAVPATTTPTIPTNGLPPLTTAELNETEWEQIKCTVRDGCIFRNRITGQLLRKIKSVVTGKPIEASVAPITVPKGPITTFREVSTIDQYSKALREDFDKGSNVIAIKFGATWCGPCKDLNPLLQSAQAKIPGVTVIHVDTDKSPELVQYFQRSGLGFNTIPATFLFKRNENTKWFDQRGQFGGGLQAFQVENFLRAAGN